MLCSPALASSSSHADPESVDQDASAPHQATVEDVEDEDVPHTFPVYFPATQEPGKSTGHSTEYPKVERGPGPGSGPVGPLRTAQDCSGPSRTIVGDHQNCCQGPILGHLYTY